MRKVKIITDSCADIFTDLLTEYDIDYVKMLLIEDGIESPALLNWDDEMAHAFFEKMRNGKRITTAQVLASDYEQTFTKYIEQGCDIVYVACSSKQSSSVSTGTVVANKLMSVYPEAKIFCIDSLNSCVGQGLIAIEAAKLAREGRGAEEIAAHVVAIKKTVHEYATVHTLEYLKRAGRVSASSAFLGNLMGVKPILVSDANGAQAAYKKAKGRANSLREIVALLKESLINSEEQTIYIGHADCNEDDINAVVAEIKAQINCKDIHIGYIGPIVGASVGPDCIGVWGFGKEVTFAAE